MCDQKGNSGRNRNRIDIIWPELDPDQNPAKLAGFVIGFDISSVMVLSNTIICIFQCAILLRTFCNRDKIL